MCVLCVLSVCACVWLCLHSWMHNYIVVIQLFPYMGSARHVFLFKIHTHAHTCGTDTVNNNYGRYVFYTSLSIPQFRLNYNLTRFNKIATQGAPQMAVDKEANSLSSLLLLF